MKAEQKVLSFDHAEAGWALLKKWNFQVEISEPIGRQYDPLKESFFKPYACMMNVTHGYIATLGQSFGNYGMALEVEPKAVEELGITEEIMQLSLITIQEKLEQIKQQLQLA